MISRTTDAAHSMNEHCSTMTNTATRNSKLSTHTRANVSTTVDVVLAMHVLLNIWHWSNNA